MNTYLHGDVPGHVDVTFELVHPNLGHSESVPPHVRSQVLGVGLVCALYVSDPSAGQDLHAASTLPHLVRHISDEKS